MASDKLYASALFAIKMREHNTTSVARHQRSGTFRPFDNQDRTIREVIFPADRKNVILAMQTVKIHVDQKDAIPTMFLHKAERRRSNTPRDTKRNCQPLRERRLSSAKIALKADYVARLQLGGQLPCKRPSLLDGTDVKRAGHHRSLSVPLYATRRTLPMDVRSRGSLATTHLRTRL